MFCKPFKKPSILIPHSISFVEKMNENESNDTSQAKVHQTVHATERANEIYIHIHEKYYPSSDAFV